MSNVIFRDWLKHQHEAGSALAAQSDLFDLEAVPESMLFPEEIAQAYVAKFYCKGLVSKGEQEIVEANEFHIGIFFPQDYLQRVNPAIALTWLYPIRPAPWFPNVRPPFICAGKIRPGTELVDLVYQCFEILTYQNFATHDSLNQLASQWARQNFDRFPIDQRPLKRRRAELKVTSEERPQ